MRYQAGDIVQVKSKSWYDDNKSPCGDVAIDGQDFTFVASMIPACGHKYVVSKIVDDAYMLSSYKSSPDIGGYKWIDEFLDQDILPAAEAIRLMLSGETLVTAAGNDCKFADGAFRAGAIPIVTFEDLRVKVNTMTRKEILYWAVNVQGWVVRQKGGRWAPPQAFVYDGKITAYEKGRIEPDGTITHVSGFYK